MQYLLNEEEMAAIRAERLAVASKLPGGSITNHLEGLKNVCQYIVCQMSENGGRLANGRKPSEKPHGCIHVKDSAYAMVKADQRTDDPPEKRFYTPSYCDKCPVAGICPQPKEWSK